jgi:hypothetical protein
MHNQAKAVIQLCPEDCNGSGQHEHCAMKRATASAPTLVSVGGNAVALLIVQVLGASYTAVALNAADSNVAATALTAHVFSAC